MKNNIGLYCCTCKQLNAKEQKCNQTKECNEPFKKENNNEHTKRDKK